MKISQTEYKIKKDLAQREITPSQNLWDSIEQELDKKSKPKKQIFWMKYASIAAVLCIGFLVYQGLQPEKINSTQMVLESQPIIKQDINFNPVTFDYVASPLPIQTEEVPLKPKPQTIEDNTQFQNGVAEEETTSIDTEVEDLLSQAQTALAKVEKEQALVSEVNTLLAEAMEQTQDEDQKQILQNMQVTTLLAEVEAEIDLQKPPNLKDKIWDALVSNLNDIKRSIVLN